MSSKLKEWIGLAFVCSLTLGGTTLIGEDSKATVEVVGDAAGVASRVFGNPFISDGEFEETIEQEFERGTNPQTLLEARLVRYFSRGEYERLVALLPEFQEWIDSWDISESIVFRSTEELLGYYNLIRAIDAKDREDADALEGYVKESFWNNPELGSLLVDLVKEHRKAARMRQLRIPMELLLTVSDGSSVSLEKLVAGKKAVFLEFWASWCAPCIELMSDLIHKAERLEPLGVRVAAINTESVEKAERFRSAQEIELPWLVEPSGGPLGQLFEIDSLPRAVLFDDKGKVLFNGHPISPSLDTALAEIGVSQ